MAYHVNPETGQINICRASEGNCPFGGPTSKENHYPTFSEAQAGAEVLLQDKYKLLANPLEMRRVEKRLPPRMVKYSELEYEDLDEVEQILMETDDVDMLRAVINREVLVTDDYRFIEAVTHNKNFPLEIAAHVAEKPSSYTVEMQRFMATSPALDNSHLLWLGYNTNDKITMQTSMENPVISADVCKQYLEIKNGDDPGTPYVFLVGNPNCPSELSKKYAQFIPKGW